MKTPLPSIQGLLAEYRSGARHPVDTVREVYAAITENSQPQAWIHLAPEAESLAVAESLQDPSLPLFGIPFAVKDNIDVQGMPTTAACPEFRFLPEKSATVVRRLQDAGAIVIGKTNMDQFATGLVGTRSPHGACHSVFHPDYISGGSSSGSAVAVAAGLVSFSLGTDTAGSGRVPAAFNHIVGLKPTRGALSCHGVVPACRSLDCVSIFARDVVDAWTVFENAAAVDANDAFSRETRSVQSTSPVRRLGVPDPRHLEFFGDHAAAEMYARAVEKMEALGAEIVEIDFEPFALTAKLLYEGPWVAERYAAVGDFLRSHREAADPTVLSIILAGADISAADAFRSMERLQELRVSAQRQWEKMDALFLPTAPTIPRLDAVRAEPFAVNSRLGTYTNFVNLLDLCGIAIPMGFRPDGLPLGVTLLAPAHCDHAIASLAARVLPVIAGETDVVGVPFPAEGLHSISCHGSRVRLAVVGAHLRGHPLNHQLTDRGATFVSACKTAPIYRLYALPAASPPKPGMIRVAAGDGSKIRVEVWEMSEAAFGSFVAAVPPPLAIGTVSLDDGSLVKGFLCESEAVVGAEEITSHGGWDAYCKSEK